MSDFSGKVVLITGASSGIGTATAILLAGRGARLSLSGRNQLNLERVRGECTVANSPLPKKNMTQAPGKANNFQQWGGGQSQKSSFII